jgi:hypothetical protein
MFPPLPRIARPGAWLANRVLRAATIATMPRWMRDLAGLRQAAAVDAAIRPWMRAQFRAVSHNTGLQLALLGWISPATRPVVEPVFRGIQPRREETLTPGEARERHQTPRPLEVYERLREGEAAADAVQASKPPTRSESGSMPARRRTLAAIDER